MPEAYDLVIACDDAVDPGTGFRGAAEIAVRDGRIAAFAPALPPHCAARHIDARGKLVCPGLIDLHVHVYEWVTNFGLHPDEAGVHSGVTTIVDQGSAGAWTIGGFDAYVARPAETDVRAFVSANLAGALKGGMEGTTLHNPAMMRIEAIAEAAAAWPNLVRGIKSHGESGGLSHWGLEVLRMAVEAGAATGLPLYVHTGELFPVDEARRPDPAGVLEQVVPVLNPGTTLAHVYSTMPDGIMGQGGAVPRAVHEALERGIHFDIGHGVNFSFDIARRMMAEGVLPNTISSDVHSDFHAYHDDSRLDYSLCGAMSKLWALGMDLADVVRRATLNAASILGEVDEIGTLAPGSRADITVLDLAEGRWTLADSTGEELAVERRLVPETVFREGREIVPDRRLLRDVCPPEMMRAAA
ncbi:MAG: amidohydrolase/deacetylase family metallohydrolase [Defluviicoccus sp.]|nr:amidohydrolase/deacetylase family metallohydrolase [Defluviicoccus sp.]